MSYSVSKLKTVAECDQSISMATERKNDLEFEQTVTSRDLTDQEKTAAITNGSLLSTNAQITGTEAAIEAMPEGEAKEDLKSKLRRLNDRRENLEERLKKGGATSLLDTELDAELIKTQVVAIEAFITEVQSRKAAI